MARILGLKLWSTRTNSSRQVVLLAGEALKQPTKGGPPHKFTSALDCGISAKIACALGSIGTAVKSGTFGQSVVSAPVHTSLKSPNPGVLTPRSASEGTATWKTCPGTRSRRHSSEKKKKVLSRQIGPPMV